RRGRQVRDNGIPPGGSMSIPADEEEAGPRIVRTKQFSVKPMSAEEAALQLELIGHDFFVFRSDESGEINVLYRRRDGGYGVIEQEVARPYRATAIRRGETQWAVAGHGIGVVELPEPGGDEVELVLRGDEKTLVVDGNRSFGTMPELEQLAKGDAVIRATRLD